MKKVRKSSVDKIASVDKKSHSIRLGYFFKQNPHIQSIRSQIPEKYLQLKRITPPDNLYLIDKNVARWVVSNILPIIQQNENQIVSETNAGLGFITAELLDRGVRLVRIYEPCSDFKSLQKEYANLYKGRFELFTKDIFLLSRYAYLDKFDHGNRVEQMLRGVPKKNWTDDPAMTIIGTIPNTGFIRFLIKSLALQNYLISFGRIQLFVFMKPRDFIILTAGPHLNLHTYQCWSVLFRLLFDYELINKFPRNVFLPWQTKGSEKTGRYPGQIDSDSMYFVRINFKKYLPVSVEDLLPLDTFVRQFFSRGTKKVVPTLEKWVPGCGLDIIVPKKNHKDYFQNLDIYTKFGDLTPEQILYIFQEVISHEGYKDSPLISMIESDLIKSETIESNLDENLEKIIVGDIEVKLD